MTDAPLRIWAVHHETQGAVMIGEWADTIRHIGGNEYHLHTREALAQSPIVQAMIAEAVEAEREACAVIMDKRGDHLETLLKLDRNRKLLTSANGGRLECRQGAAAIRRRG